MDFKEFKKEILKYDPDVIMTMCKMISSVCDAIKALTKELEDIAKERAENG